MKKKNLSGNGNAGQAVIFTNNRKRDGAYAQEVGGS